MNYRMLLKCLAILLLGGGAIGCNTLLYEFYSNTFLGKSITVWVYALIGSFVGASLGILMQLFSSIKQFYDTYEGAHSNYGLMKIHMFYILTFVLGYILFTLLPATLLHLNFIIGLTTLMFFVLYSMKYQFIEFLNNLGD